jgi:hypothetical protein
MLPRTPPLIPLTRTVAAVGRIAEGRRQATIRNGVKPTGDPLDDQPRIVAGLILPHL